MWFYILEFWMCECDNSRERDVIFIFYFFRSFETTKSSIILEKAFENVLKFSESTQRQGHARAQIFKVQKIWSRSRDSRNIHNRKILITTLPNTPPRFRMTFFSFFLFQFSNDIFSSFSYSFSFFFFSRSRLFSFCISPP